MGRLRVDRLAGGGTTLAVDGRPLADRCYLATTPWARAVGLLGTPDLEPGEALWITRCRSVHTVGMRLPISCAFLDGRGTVLRIIDRLDPCRRASEPGASAVVESRVGAFEGVAPGRLLRRVASPPRSRPPPAKR